MNEKTKRNLLHDINAIFDSIAYELCSSANDWVEVHLVENLNIMACDFPHLLAIAENYDVNISIFVVKLNQLGIFFQEV